GGEGGAGPGRWENPRGKTQNTRQRPTTQKKTNAGPAPNPPPPPRRTAPHPHRHNSSSSPVFFRSSGSIRYAGFVRSPKKRIERAAVSSFVWPEMRTDDRRATIAPREKSLAPSRR